MPVTAQSDHAVETELSGLVKWYNETKGYGFITAEDGRDVFVHHSGLNTQGFAKPAAGERVTFDLADGPRGPKAINVRF